MKVKEGFVLRKVGSDYLVVAVGERVKEFNGMLTLNETSKIIYDCLLEGLEKEDILKRFLDEYNVDEKRAMDAINKTIEKFLELKIIE